MRKPFLIVLVPLIALLMTAGFRTEGTASSWKRTFEIRTTITVRDIPDEAGLLNLWIPYPIESSQQVIEEFRIDSPFPHTLNREGKFGNRMIFLSIPDPPSSFGISMSYTVRRHESSGESSSPETQERIGWSLESSRLIPLSPFAAEIARTHADPKSSLSEQARSLYDHTLSHMNYDKTGEGWGNGDFQYACDYGKGNCTDYHSYFIGLCRNIGIPAYFEIGYSVPSNLTEGTIPGYHCWAYFWDGKAWIPVDISEADKNREKTDYYFGHHDPNRVALSRGRDITLSPPQNEGSLNYFVFPYSEVDGRKHGAIDWTITFKEATDL